jgi:hypothetical protein
MMNENKLECIIKEFDYKGEVNPYYYVYFGFEVFVVDTRTAIYKHASMCVDNALEKANGDMDKFNSLMRTRLGKMTQIGKIINTIVVLYKNGFHDCLKDYNARLFELIRNGSLKKNG